MGRMHAPGKGLTQSALPYHCSVPTWLKLTSDDMKEQIYKLAKKALTPSQIECRLVQLLRKTVWRFLNKFKIELPYDQQSIFWVYIQRR
uniref:Small ribosomal subunit protein uS15 N-terminal domain-containing protein n=1 Tax=Cebus imitator TaxID=2715852 RepID=A0A2K5RY63_CEBIM